VTTHTVDLPNERALVAARVRRELEAKGELQPPLVRRFLSPLDAEERAAVAEALRTGAYERAVVEVGRTDPDLAGG